MGTDQTTNTPSASQMGDAELSALADRLQNRADSVVMRDQPEQQRDLRAAAAIVLANASLIRRLAYLQGELRRAADTTKDEATERHLRELLGGA